MTVCLPGPNSSPAAGHPDASLKSADGRASKVFPVVELRQYTLHPGKRDELIALFEREFVESQEALGMKVIGTFTDLDRADRFVWLRGFPDMESRVKGLTEFYTGPVWAAHRNDANATMIDSDNVLLLEAPVAGAEFDLPAQEARAIGQERPAGLVIGTIYYLAADPIEFISTFQAQLNPELARAGVQTLAWFVPESLPNNFPRLPVREGENTFVWFASFRDFSDYEDRRTAIQSAESAVEHWFARPREVLRLKPTARSLLRGTRPVVAPRS